MGLNIPGIVSIIVFYLLILFIGLYAAWKKREKKEQTQNRNERAMIGGRDLGLFVLTFTMTATWVGGGYINGTAEVVYTPGSGLIWTQAPFGYAASLIVGGFLFAKQMRKQGYITMLDPLQQKLGKRMGGFLYLPALCGELFWSAAILAALGGTLSIVVGLDRSVAVIVSAGIAVFYTLIGGLYSVAYTDVIQLICIFVGLWLSIPFAFTHPAVGDITNPVNGSLLWVGSWNVSTTWKWMDSAFLLIFGGIPWQVYFQRVLASDTEAHAQIASFVASFGCFVMAIPSVLIGAIATTTNWNDTAYGEQTPFEKGEQSMILPIVLQNLTPVAVSFVGLGAVSAAVMSSADSSLLSASSMFTRNVYNHVFRQNATENELSWILRASILVMGGLSCFLALVIKSVYDLWYLSSDFVYVILFPQLFGVLYFNPNTYGSVCAFILGLTLRLGGGEPAFNLDPYIPYPGGSNFPYKTFSMLMSMATLLLVSYIAQQLFQRQIIPRKHDIFQCNLAEGGRSILSQTEAKNVNKSETDCHSNFGFVNDDYEKTTQL